jgi:iron complex outermembrane receptor protein
MNAAKLFGIQLLSALCLTASALSELQAQDSQSLEDLLNTTISAAAKYEQKSKDAPASVSIISAEDIRKSGYTTLAEVLNKECGFFLSDDRNYTFVGMRGFLIPGSYNNKILILLDGHSLNESVYGSGYYGDEYALNFSSIERIEIVRGPGSALYGSNALFAVINIVTKSAKQIDGASAKFDTDFNKKGILSGHFGKEFSDDFKLTISGELGSDKGRDFDFRELKTKSKDKDNAKYYGAYLKSEIFGFNLSAQASFHEKFLPTAKYETDPKSDKQKECDTRAFVEIKRNDQIRTDFSINSRVYFDYYNFYGIYPYAKFDQMESNLASTFGAEIQSIYDLDESDRLTMGVSYDDNYKCSYSSVINSDDKLFYSNRPFKQYAIYINNAYQILENLALTLGLRQDWADKNFKALSPRAALVYSPFENGSFKLLYGEAYRRPNLYESEYRDSLTQLQSVGLKEERIKTYELVVEQGFFNKLLLGASLYYYHLDNLIGLSQASEDKTVFKNYSNCKTFGAEFKAFYKATSDFDAYANLSLNKTDINKSEFFISSPKYTMNLGARKQIIEYLDFAFDIIIESSRKTYINEETNAFAFANAYITYSPKFDFLTNSESLRFSLKLNNLLDSEYYNAVGIENPMTKIVQPGFNLLFSISASI